MRKRRAQKKKQFTGIQFLQAEIQKIDSRLQ